MRSKYRCVHDIIYDVLRVLACGCGVVKTKLCSYSNLPFDRCDRLLNLLESYGLIFFRGEGGVTLVYLTDVGYAYIGLYDELSTLLPLGRVRK